ncbi:MAG TPA: GNAT family N-acetyltransferase [Chitinophagaceae bacterium]
MEIRTLTQCKPEAILQAFNASFTGYFVPLQLTADQLSAKLSSDKVDLRQSAGAFVNGELAGFILHGFDVMEGRKIIYNAGTGVIPAYRHQGLVKKMYDYVTPSFRSNGIDSVLLEVITRNIPAIRSYERSGFENLRKLTCYKGEVQAIAKNDCTIKELDGYDWKQLKSFWDFTPTWQHSMNVVEDLKNTNRSLGAFIADKLVGYIVYNPVTKRVAQFGVDRRFRRKGIGSTLFSSISEAGQVVSVINVEETALETNAFLQKIGLVNFIDQYEMRLELNRTKFTAGGRN